MPSKRKPVSQRLKNSIGRVVNPVAHMEIKRQERGIAEKKVQITRLQGVSRFLSAPRRGEYLTPAERAARNTMSKKGKAGGYR